MNNHLLIIFLLGFSSGLPMALVSSTLQAWFASTGMSIAATGMLSLLSLPYVYRFLWAPVVDRYTLGKMGKRRSWILCTQLLIVMCLNLMAWCSPVSNPIFMAILACLLAFIASTQDTAIDAHRTELLNTSEQGLGASLAVAGYRLAMIVSGGIGLILAQHFGFDSTYRIMSLCMMIGVLATIMAPEPVHQPGATLSLAQTFWYPLKELLGRKGVKPVIGFIFFYKLGEAFTTSTSGIMMPFLIQELGFSLETVGVVNKLAGIASLLLGGLIAGIILIKKPLHSALLYFGLLQAVTNLLFVALAIKGPDLMLFIAAVVFDNFAAGMGTTALVVYIMRSVDRHYTATQYAILVSISALPRVLSGPMAAFVQAYVGWVGLFIWSSFLALLFIPFLRVIHKVQKSS